MDVFAVIRWMSQDFNELRMKDNMNIENKRLRCNEYIASLLTQEFSKKLNRIMSLGGKATIDNLREIFKFPGDRIRVSPLNLSNCGKLSLSSSY